MKNIYFDYAATTPTDPLVMRVMEPYFFEHFGNASSPHTIGRLGQKAVEEARANLADFIGASANEIIFNSGATEGNNHAIAGVAQALKGLGKHIIVSAIEHHSVLEPAEHLETQGYKVTYLPVGETGKVDPKTLSAAITDQTILVAIMHASNEIGSIQPIAELSQITRDRKIPFLVDACQTVGHIPVNVDELGADLLSLSAHKFYGPKGVGALYIRRKTPLEKLIRGGDQEFNHRASTQNVPGIVGLSEAVNIARDQMEQESIVQARFRDKMITEIPKRIKGARCNGHLTDRLPNNVHFSFEHLEGESLLMALDMKHIAASMGSACTSGAMAPSHVLRAIGLSDELAYGSLRLTIGRWTDEEQIDYLLEQLPELVSGLRI